MKTGNTIIISNIGILHDYFKMEILAPEAAKIAEPGQFLMFRAGKDNSTDPFLGRPMSLNHIDRLNGHLGIIYQVVGRGTVLLSQLKEGDTVFITGPWGKGWQTDNKIKRAALVGGGAGIAPLLPLAEELNDRGVKMDIFIGASNRERLFNDKEMASYGDVVISTIDGSVGKPGLIDEQLPDEAGYDMVFTCGPKIMMEKVAAWAKRLNIPCQVSLEERMGCGFGVCAGCVCQAKNSDGSTSYKRVCKEGPVFFAGEVFDND